MAKILIAEDERDIRDLITFTLRFAGHEVVATSNGEEAYLKAQEVIPDLILMDVRMPRMTGYEACEKMKQIDALKFVPVVFLSAKGQESEVQAGLDAGAVEYILKPFAPDQLTSRINAILEKFASGQASAQSPEPAATPAPEPASTRPPSTSIPKQPPAAAPTPPASIPEEDDLAWPGANLEERLGLDSKPEDEDTKDEDADPFRRFSG